MMAFKPLIAAKAKENQKGGQGGVLLSVPAQKAKVNTNKELAKAAGIECSLAGRQGSNQHTQKIAEAPKGESRDIAAKAVDLNPETYRQAKDRLGTYAKSCTS